MSLDAFKTIYWWEWTHRLLGRLIGVGVSAAVSLVPVARLGGAGAAAAAVVHFRAGALQGAVGWWMVASGLAERVEVSQYRLATHLVLACAIYVAMIWTAQRLRAIDRPLAGRAGCRAASRFGAIVLLVLVLVQIYLGALVAGLRAGYIYNTWPLIDGALIPDAARLFFNTPLWRNFFENTLTVQFDHRMLAYAIFVWRGASRRSTSRARVKAGPPCAGAVVLFAAVTLQVALGIATLLLVVPLPLALVHQAMAMLVLTAATLHAANCSSVPRIPAQAETAWSPLSRGPSAVKV